MSDRITSSATEARQGLAEVIIETAHDAFIGMGQDGCITHWNSKAAAMFGWTGEEAIGKFMAELIVPPEQREAHARGMARYLSTGQQVMINRRVHLQALHRSGALIPVEMTISAYQEGTQCMFFAFLHNASERDSKENELLKLARTDSLTALPNRRYLYERLHETMNRVGRTRRLMAVLFMDIDHFKSINDGLGHDVGDQLLQQFAARLQASVRQVDFVARLGGDEFMVLIEELGGEETAAIVAQKILDGMAAGFQIPGHSLRVTTSIGISLYAGGPLAPDALVRRADQAMYQAKRSGRNTFRIAREDQEPISNDNSAAQPIAHFLAGADKPRLDVDGFIQEALRAIRTHLDMDVAYVSHFTGGRRVFRYIDAKDTPPIAVGHSDPLEETLCVRVADGRLPEIMPDAFQNTEAMTVAITTAVPVRAHMSVPIVLKNGQVYGAYCCVSYAPDQSLNARDIGMMRIFADLVARQLERET